ncbi:DDE family transposase [Kribbella sp. VKM Ac-2527]|uniref:DDE family transposase n=1 Tax=Kribbella caucasensis TaxID=2512215 RepID=A0A4R6KJN1_9ACTN|nr:DDE family transposase [Kribbella sp. VKM Ac-2527]
MKTTNGSRTLDEASLARARRLAGLKGYVTNIPADVMDAGEVIGTYHDLWHVEQSFRMSKTDLRARPMFHHTRDAIEAHLTIVFTALAVSREVQNRTGLAIRNSSASCGHYGPRPSRSTAPSRHSHRHPHRQQAILDALKSSRLRH